MQTNPLLVELYTTDDAGKPIALFEIEHGPAPRKAQVELHHANYALPALEAIDKRIDDILLSLGKHGQSVCVLMDEIEILQTHGCKLQAQTIYLDTSDRNSWISISQTMLHSPNKNSIYGHHAKNLRNFWKGRLDPVRPTIEPEVGL